ncbi:MAG: MFS transporter [Deltaproteobacteria bacterium]|nr:MFS transporter [Deltaproteobacteria bacterium]
MNRTTRPATDTLLPAILAGAFTLVSATGNFFLTVYFREELGFSGARIGLLYALQAVAGVLVALPAGLGNDRILTRHMVAGSLLVQAAGFAVMAGVEAFLPFAGVFLLWNLAANVFRMSLDIHVLKHDDGVQTAPRVARFQAARYGGFAAGTVAAGGALDALGFHPAFLLTAAVVAALALASRALPATAVHRAPMAAYRRDLRAPGVLFFYAWLFLFATHWGAEFTSYSLFLREDLRLSLQGMGWYMAAEFVAMAAAFLFQGHRPRALDRLRSLAVTGLVLSGAGQVAMTLTGVPALSCACRFVHGLGDASVLLVFYLGVARLFVAERLGGNSGMVNTMTMLGMVVGALVYGPLGEAAGYGVPLAVSGGITAVLALPVLVCAPPDARGRESR